MPVKIDLHVHTTYSNDSIITPKDLFFYAQRSGLNAVAVTDHNTMEGAKKIAKETKNFLVIPGMEVSSLNGHIVALNVIEKIPRDRTAAETVDLIHRAGGVAVACHPFAMLKGCVGKYVTDKFDAIEVINASAFPFGSSVQKALETAEKLGLPKVAGTDAHYGPVIGCAYTVVDAEPTVDAVLAAIVKGCCEPQGGCISWLMRAENQGRFFKKYLGTRGRRAS
jgi:predicted metal-dependent phosphoesterase TrpH